MTILDFLSVTLAWCWSEVGAPVFSPESAKWIDQFLRVRVFFRVDRISSHRSQNWTTLYVHNQVEKTKDDFSLFFLSFFLHCLRLGKIVWPAARAVTYANTHRHTLYTTCNQCRKESLCVILFILMFYNASSTHNLAPLQLWRQQNSFFWTYRREIHGRRWRESRNFYNSVTTTRGQRKYSEEIFL